MEAEKTLSDEEYDRLTKRFDTLFADAGGLEEIETRLGAMRADPDVDGLRDIFCNQLLYAFCAGYDRFPERDTDEIAWLKQMFIRNVQLLTEPEKYVYYQAVVCFFRNDQKGCLRWLEKVLSVSRAGFAQHPMNETTWADFFLDTFKNAFPGFWKELGTMLRSYPCEEEVVELCGLIEAFYQCKTDDETIDLLLPYAVQHPGLSLPKELLGFAYIGKKMWSNALACFRQVENASVLFYYEDIDFWLAVCCGKLRDLAAEEKHYRACLSKNAGYPDALNNLGYCLYRQKRYTEALEVLEQCLEEQRDLPYSANNYVRALLAAGQNAKARAFVERGEFKISSELRKRALQRDGVDHPLNSATMPQTEPDQDEDFQAEERLPDFGIKHRQFSSERVLEDELTARIEAGREVFGRKLKLYQRPGDFYGRQYPIDDGKGRLDLFCEDAEGNLYAIELKKDSGYDDAYAQTKRYVEWIRKHRCQKGKQVYGIICLSDPTPALVEQVRGDGSIYLYEYQISYREIK